MKNILSLLILQSLTACSLAGDIDDLLKNSRYQIRGNVYDADTGEPLVGVVATINDERDLTDPEGNFAFRLKAFGSYNLQFEADGYKPYALNVDLQNKEAVVDIALTRDDIIIDDHRSYGYVIDSATNRALTFTNILIDGREYDTGAAGRFEFDFAIVGTTYELTDIEALRDCLTIERLAFQAYPHYSSFQIYVRITEGSTRQFGDLNGDRFVDIQDIDLFVPHMNSAIGDSHYLASADLNDDGKIDIRDYQIIRQHFHQTVFPDSCD